jgi:N-acylneuraminate cytidylyltransferase
VTTEKAKFASALVVIPARGGSKGIPLKNLQVVGEHTLIARAINASLACPLTAQVLVSTDSDLIANEALQHGALVAKRPESISGDTASSESALLDALAQYEASDQTLPDIVVFVQCTSPFINPRSLTNAINTIALDRADVVFSAVEDHSFRWTTDSAGQAHAVGHDATHRPRRQDLPPSFRETGAFYAMRTSGFLEHHNRFFGRIGLEQVELHESYEIDTPEDLDLCRAIAHQDIIPASPSAPVNIDEVRRRGLDVDALITDFDGVHTNDTAIIAADGTEQVQVSRSDGMGIAQLRNQGIPLLILSTETNPIVSARAKKLGIDVLQGINNKAEALSTWLAANRLDPQRVAYVGNDINDLPAMALVGWPIAVADAREEARAHARLVLSRNGGQGAVREICDLILTARGSRPTSATKNFTRGEAHPRYTQAHA